MQSLKMKYSNYYQNIVLGAITYLLVFNNTDVGAQSKTNVSNKVIFGNWGVETQFISRKIAPGDDFYRFVNEGWLTTKTIPSGSSGLSNYSEVKKTVNERIADLITMESNKKISSKPLQQLRALYQGYLDTAQMETFGTKTIEREVNRILSIKSHDSIAKWMANPKSFSIVTIHTQPDISDRSKFLVTFSESGIGLPSPMYYQKEDGPYPGYLKA
ncbi:hypothetical protein, partial [Pedobacter agri]